MYLLEIVQDAHNKEYDQFLLGTEPDLSDFDEDGLQLELARCFRRGRKLQMIQSIPHLLLLDSGSPWVVRDLRPLFAKTCLRYLILNGLCLPREGTNKSKNIPPPTTEELLLSYVSIPDGAVVDGLMKRQLGYHMTPFSVQLLNLVRKIVTSILPHVCSKVRAFTRA